ncbi:FtsX-like permease family protein [Arthrobacter psychrochitiniphilus]|uniref:FtsX-like permease family protein n=1 Tax=Arthrobacter psychrochitiniphilus TaxID=291045 RepID=UPI003F7C1C89
MALDLKPVKGGGQHRLKVALKMAWRDIRRHRGRSALIVALIALPIFAMSFAATAGMSTMPTNAETVTTQLGQTQGRLGTLGAQNAKAIQSIGGDTGYGGWHGGGEPDPNFVPTAPMDAVPAGFTVLPWHSTTVHTAVGKAQVEVNTTVTDVLNPAFKGKYTLRDGAAPATASQALATRGLLERFDLALGDELTTSAGTFAIVGTIRPEGQGDGESYLFLTPEQLSAALTQNLGPATAYLVGERALRWDDAKELNAQGVVLSSRSLILDPPSKAELGADAEILQNGWRSSAMVQMFLMGGLIGVLALLEVGLLAGAAFAVGARKQQRDLALLAASGAESSMVRTTVTASGLWLGLAGGVIGAVLGTIAAVITVLVVRNQGLTIFTGLHLMWLPALGLILVGVVAGLVAAMVPARAVAKQATLSALKSGRTADAPSKWGTRIGGGLLLLSATLMAASSIATISLRGNKDQYLWAPWLAGAVVVGAVLLVFALIFMTGRLIELLTTRTSWLPVPLRLAARDAARNRGRTVPAVAAVLAAATLSGALMVGTASTMADASDKYTWQANLNQSVLLLNYVDYNYVDVGGGAMSSNAATMVTVDADDANTLLKEALGAGVRTQLLRGVPDTSKCEIDQQNEQMKSPGRELKPTVACPRWLLAEPVGNSCELGKDWKPVNLDDWRCTGALADSGLTRNLPTFVVGGEAELAALLGRAPSAEARKTLATGGMVLANKVYLQPDDTATVISYDPSDEENFQGYDPTSPDTNYMRHQWKALTSHSIPAVVDAPEKPLPYFGIMSPDAAAAAGMPVSDQALLATIPEPLAPAERDQLQSAMTPVLGQNGYMNFETGPATNMAIILWVIVIGGALITLSAAGITAGLALADGRNDHATLASVGADTRLRKAISGSQTLMTALLGTVLGVIAGAIPTVVVLSQQRGAAIVVPWLQLGALAVLVPLFGAGAAWVLTKGKLPLTRRQTLA